MIGRLSIALVLVVLSALVIGCDSTLPADIYRIGSARVPSTAESVGAISQAEALRAASDAGYDFANRSAYLVYLTPSGAGDAWPYGEHLVWLVRAEDINMRGPVPTGADEPLPYQFAYIVVDALTAEVLMATYRV